MLSFQVNRQKALRFELLVFIYLFQALLEMSGSFSFLIIYITCVKMNADLLDLESTNGNEIFVQKCIGFITQLAVINTCEKILKLLHKMFVNVVEATKTKSSLSVESFLYNLLYEVSFRLGRTVILYVKLLVLKLLWCTVELHSLLLLVNIADNQ